MKDLEIAINKLIEEIYCKKYIGRLKVTETFTEHPVLRTKEHTGYNLELGLNKDLQPVTLAFQGTKEEFLKFIEKELRHNNYDKVKFFTGQKLYFNNDCEK